MRKLILNCQICEVPTLQCTVMQRLGVIACQCVLQGNVTLSAAAADIKAHPKHE